MPGQAGPLQGPARYTIRTWRTGRQAFGRTTQNLFPLRVGKDSPGFSAGLADVDPARPSARRRSIS